MRRVWKWCRVPIFVPALPGVPAASLSRAFCMSEKNVVGSPGRYRADGVVMSACAAQPTAAVVVRANA